MNYNFGVIVKRTCFSFKWCIILQKSKMWLKTGFVQMVTYHLMHQQKLVTLKR